MAYCIVIPILVIFNFATKPQVHWFWWPMFGWGIGVALHALQTFSIGKNWEVKKIQAILKNQMELKEKLAYEKAKERVTQLKGFYIHLLVYILVNTFIIFYTSEDLNSLKGIGPYYTAIFWGIGLAVHAIRVFVPKMIFTKEWEEKKIKEILNPKP